MAADYYDDLCDRVAAYCTRMGIARPYPPATEAQILATEDALGFRLPDALRRLYLRVANGGPDPFGGFGLFGCIGGYACSSRGPRATLEQLVSRSQWRLNARVAAALRRHPGASINSEVQPDGFVLLSVIDENYGQELWLDPRTAGLYVYEAMGRSDYWEIHGDVEKAMQAKPGVGAWSIAYEAAGVEQWLELWMSDPGFPYPNTGAD